MNCKILLGDASSNEHLNSSEDLAEGIEGVYTYEYEAPTKGNNAPPYLSSTDKDIIRKFGYAKLFFANWTAQDTCSRILVWNPFTKQYEDLND